MLADINVIQGEPAQFEVEVPAGYEVTGASGASVDSSDVQSGVLTLKVNAPAQRNHQFLISMEKPIVVTKAEVPFLSVKNSQRETGEVLVEGVGTMELTAKEGGSLKRMDVKETNPYLRSLARSPLQAAFRLSPSANGKSKPGAGMDAISGQQRARRSRRAGRRHDPRHHGGKIADRSKTDGKKSSPAIL